MNKTGAGNRQLSITSNWKTELLPSPVESDYLSALGGLPAASSTSTCFGKINNIPQSCPRFPLLQKLFWCLDTHGAKGQPFLGLFHSSQVSVSSVQRPTSSARAALLAGLMLSELSPLCQGDRNSSDLLSQALITTGSQLRPLKQLLALCSSLEECQGLKRKISIMRHRQAPTKPPGVFRSFRLLSEQQNFG